MTPARSAITWVLARGEHLVPIPSTKRRAYLEQNAAAAGIALPEDDLAPSTRNGPRPRASATTRQGREPSAF